MLAVGALISFLGVPAGLLGNEFSIRYGLRKIATLVFLLSAFAGGLFGFTAVLPYIAVLWLSVVIGFVVQGNFSNLTSGVLAVAAPHFIPATVFDNPVLLQPHVKGLTLMVNSIFNGWRMEDVWFDK